jgi:hypothetical protein
LPRGKRASQVADVSKKAISPSHAWRGNCKPFFVESDGVT